MNCRINIFKFLSRIFPLFLCSFSFAQQSPKLIIGITVDQMRWDYLSRYKARFLPGGGFSRFLEQGYRCDNTHIGYTPTFTASGHAGIYTGSVPALHGITGNEWLETTSGNIIYCTEDKSVQTVGSTTEAGMMSPVNMLSTTICDELRLATNFRSKTIGIAIKDRGAILPAGHSANASYWYDNKAGEWITSTWYMKELPAWVKAFNTKGKVDSLYQLGWNTLYPPETYVQSSATRKSYELRSFGSPSKQFPYDLKSYAGVNYNIIQATPHGNTLTTEFAKSAIFGEQLGADSIADFLAISYSSPDYIGHAFGPNAMETEDMYLRFDAELGKFFEFLDKQVGSGKYLVFLSADHGASHVPGFLKENKLPGGLIDDGKLNDQLNAFLKDTYGSDQLSLGIINFQVILNKAVIEKSNKLKEPEITAKIIDWLEKQEGVSRAFKTGSVIESPMPVEIRNRFTNGFYPSRSGHIQIVYKPGYIEGFLTGGTTHGSWYGYDSHIPLLWYGWKIPKGSTKRSVCMADIAPTLAALLEIQEPSGSIGTVIQELFK